MIEDNRLREALAERLTPFVWSTGDVNRVIEEIAPIIAAHHVARHDCGSRCAARAR